MGIIFEHNKLLNYFSGIENGLAQHVEQIPLGVYDGREIGLLEVLTDDIICWENHALPILDPDQPELTDLVNPMSRHMTRIPYLTRNLSSMIPVIFVRSL